MTTEWKLLAKVEALSASYQRSLGDLTKMDYHGKALIAELKKMSETICQECYGYGHARKQCPTYTKI